MANKSQSSPSTSSPGRFYLPPSLRVEVRSPGFSSRISALVEEGNKDMESKRRSSPLKPPPGASNFNPNYSGFGTRPKIILNRNSLPLFNPRHSPKVNLIPRTATKYPITTVKVAPSTPFSPFRSSLSQSPFGTGTTVGSSVPTSAALSDAMSSQNSVSDPRKVVMALQELSRSRKRGLTRRFLKCNEEEDDYEDEEEETGSKRARRDSSSSIGSSLSMEMPPLFSNGVVGQTTSHLVSRETDLSLTSLLSKSQAIFGHSNKNMGSHIQNQPPLGLSQQSLGQQSGACTKKQKATTNEIQSSLSSSMRSKRVRDSSSGNESSSNEDQENDVLSTSKNRIVAPGNDRKSVAKRPRSSGCSECLGKEPEKVGKKRVSFNPDDREIPSYCPKTSSPLEVRPKTQVLPAGIKGIVIPKLSEFEGSKKLFPKKYKDLDDEFESRKTVITSIEALDHDKEHDKKRARYLLSGLEPNEETNPIVLSKSTPLNIVSAAPPSVDPIPISTILSIPIASPVSPVEESTISNISKAPTQPEIVSISEPKSSESEKTAEDQISSIVSPTIDSKKEATTAKVLGVETPVAASLIVSTSTEANTTTTLSSKSTPGFNFGLKQDLNSVDPVSTKGETKAIPATTSSLFQFGFSSLSTSAPTGVTTSSTVSTANSISSVQAIPSTSQVEISSTTVAQTATTPSALPLFSFGKATTATSLSFGTHLAGQTVSPATTIPSPKQDPPPKQDTPAFGGFEATADKIPKTFSFGETSVQKTSEKAPSNLFSFGAKAASTEATSDVPKFSFGAQPVEKKETSSNLFSFGGPASKSTEDTKVSFAFGSSSKTNEKIPTPPAPLSFSFGKAAPTTNVVLSPTPTFSFVKPASSESIVDTNTSTATPTPSLFQFGSTPQSKPPPATNQPGVFQFGSAQSTTSSSVNQTKPYGFGSSSQAPSSDIFKFGSSSTSSTTLPSTDLFKFGQSTPSSTPALSFSSALKPQQSAPSPFQANQTSSLQAKAPSLPQFGGPANTSSNIFSFGSSNQPAVNSGTTSTGMFQFGSPAPPLAPTGGFNFTSPNTSSSTPFRPSVEPAAPAPAPQGGFNFSASASIPGAFSFGATAAPNPSYSFGNSTSAAPSGFGMLGSSPQVQAQPSMFSIGSGTSAPKGRTIAKARRTRR